MPSPNHRAAFVEDQSSDGETDFSNDHNSYYESEELSTHSDSDADNSAPAFETRANEGDNHRNEDDLRATYQNRQQGPSEGLPVPQTISQKDISAAGSIDLQMLAEKSNELALPLAGQDSREEHRRGPSKHRRTFVEPESFPGHSPAAYRNHDTFRPGPGFLGGPPSVPPPPPGARPPSARPPPPPSLPFPLGGRPPAPPGPPTNSLLEKLLPGSILRNMFQQNWSNPRVSEPYLWRDRLRVTGRRKSESSLDNYRQEGANSPSVYHNLPPDMSSRNLLASWRLRGPGPVQMKEPIPTYKYIPNQSIPDLGAELGRTAERFFGLDLYDDNPQSLFISYLLDTIEKIRYERNFMESLLTQPIIRPAPPPPGPRAIPETVPKSVPRARRQVLHRVLCVARYHDHNEEGIFEDAPVKTFSEISGDWELDGKMAVAGLGRYCVQNPDISFIIFKEHQCVQGERPIKRQLESKHRIYRSSSMKISHRAERMVIPPGMLQSAIVQVALCDPPRPAHGNNVADINEKMIEMDAPYLFLYHHRTALRKLSEEESDPMTEHVLVLLDFLDSNWEAEYHEADNQFDSGIVTNKHIDKLFRPNDIVIQKSKETIRAYVIATWPHRLRDTSLEIHCWSWIYNGISLQRDYTILQIPLPLPDGSTIADMPICPISKTDNTIIEELRIRGKKFWAMKERYFGCYSGFDTKRTKNHHHTRVVIDIQTYSRMHPKDHASETSASKGSSSRIGTWPISIPWEDELDDLTVILLPTVVYGFWLQEKTWLRLDISGIHPVEWNKSAFDRLVLDPKTKELITALVQVRIATGRAEDIIEGKGNGLMILLHGGPGTGKTLTAESVAEIAEKPLYRVTCGDVGTKVVEVERYLQTVLYLGKTWNCVLLLDEADVFLEERGIADLERNSLVSVFLRILEYYDGILIMTSNRVGIFDEAFKSRIQVSLHYEDLTKSARRTIWNNFIVMLEEAGADVNVSDLESHLDDLSLEELNGRQIRNAITTARQLAVYRKERLDWEHLDQVLKTAREFNRYLKTVQGHTDRQWAREQRLR